AFFQKDGLILTATEAMNSEQKQGDKTLFQESKDKNSSTSVYSNTNSEVKTNYIINIHYTETRDKTNKADDMNSPIDETCSDYDIMTSRPDIRDLLNDDDDYDYDDSASDYDADRVCQVNGIDVASTIKRDDLFDDFNDFMPEERTTQYVRSEARKQEMREI